MIVTCAACRAAGRTCIRCRRHTASAVARWRQRRRAVQIISKATQGRADPFLLPDDGLLDKTAVWVAVGGQRKVRLTGGERLAAAVRILAGHGTVREVCVRLALPAIVSEDMCQISPVTSGGRSPPSVA